MNSYVWSAREDGIGNYNSRMAHCIWIIRTMDFDIDLFSLFPLFVAYDNITVTWGLIFTSMASAETRGNLRQPEGPALLPDPALGRCSLPTVCLQRLSSLVLPTQRSEIPDQWDSAKHDLGAAAMPKREHPTAEGMLSDVSIPWDILGKISKNLSSCTCFPFVECSLSPVTGLFFPSFFF